MSTPSQAAAQSGPGQRSTLRRVVGSTQGAIGLSVLAVMFLFCIGTLPWTAGRRIERTVETSGQVIERIGPPRYAWQDKSARQLPPTWWPIASDPKTPWLPADPDLAERVRATALERAEARLSLEEREPTSELKKAGVTPTEEEIRAARPFYVMGTDLLGQNLFIRVLAGGGVSLVIGVAAAFLSVVLGTTYGMIAGYVGGRTDGVMMRIVDILYGLPYVLLVVLLAVAGDAVLDEFVSRAGARAAMVTTGARDRMAAQGVASTSEAGVHDWLTANPDQHAELETLAAARYQENRISDSRRTLYELLTLLVAIGGVSWLTMARVVRGQVLSLKSQPFMEAARAMGAPIHRQFLRHLLPNLVGPIVVYATLTVPQAILQESFLSFLGIGVRPPLPSWGNLAADGLSELNPYKSRWWLLVFPCGLLGLTLLALNFVGEGLRAAMDPKRRRR